jgi:glycosyltransferase involved in cell wall biosynthesis
VKEGGPSFAAKAMADALADRGVKVTIATTMGSRELATASPSKRGQGARHGESVQCRTRSGDSEAGSREGEGYSVICFRREFEPYKVSFGLTRWLRKNIAGFDLVHIHALFSFSSTVTARIARKKNVPYIVRPLGVLNRWGMRNRRRGPKLVSFRLVELPILLNSAAIHFTSEAERKEAAELNRKLAEHESAVIPLPIEQRAWSTELATASPSNGGQGGESGRQFLLKFPRARGKRVVLFLSRIDPKKGLELLLDAFAVVRQKEKDVALVIAGEGEESYVRELRERGARSREQGALSTERGGWSRGSEEEDKEGEGNDQAHEHDDVIWTGHLSGEMKAAALAAADVFVLPSASENFGIAAAESLAAGVPTIVSEEVALSSDIRRYDAGVVVKRDVQQLAGAISDLLSNRERAAGLAANGRRLAEERYSPEAVGRALHELYQKIIT